MLKALTALLEDQGLIPVPASTWWHTSDASISAVTRHIHSVHKFRQSTHTQLGKTLNIHTPKYQIVTSVIYFSSVNKISLVI